MRDISILRLKNIYTKGISRVFHSKIIYKIVLLFVNPFKIIFDQILVFLAVAWIQTHTHIAKSLSWHVENTKLNPFE